MADETRIGVRIPHEMKERFKQYAAADGDRSMSSFIRKTLELGLWLYENPQARPETPVEQMKKNGARPLPLVEA